jgi:3-hydroxymyristoyl/3-hydroxydecanoyl-(acyl carrier protein) dehydratase
MTSALHDRAVIEELLPHRAPFLFVDRVMQFTVGRRLLAELDLRGTEPHFAGHFPGRPMMPGVLVSEALAQTAGLLAALSARAGRPLSAADPRFMVLAAVNVKFLRPAVPGECLSLQADFERTLGPLYHFKVAARAGRSEIAAGTLVLAARGEGA